MQVLHHSAQNTRYVGLVCSESTNVEPSANTVEKSVAATPELTGPAVPSAVDETPEAEDSVEEVLPPHPAKTSVANASSAKGAVIQDRFTGRSL